MNPKLWIKYAQQFAVENAPAILTGIGVAGTISTTFLTAKATFKAADILAEEDKDISTRDKFFLVWKVYVPAGCVGTVTIAAIVMSNRITSRRLAAMATAYTLSEKAYNEYQEKIRETFGKNKAEKVKDDIAQDQVSNNPVTNQQVIVTSHGDVLCYEAHSGRYFNSDMEALKKAQNDFNYQMLNHGYGALSDFYDYIGLAHTKMSDDLGWNSDNLLELRFTTTMSDDQRPCIHVDFTPEPSHGFYRTH